MLEFGNQKLTGLQGAEYHGRKWVLVIPTIQELLLTLFHLVLLIVIDIEHALWLRTSLLNLDWHRKVTTIRNGHPVYLWYIFHLFTCRVCGHECKECFQTIKELKKVSWASGWSHLMDLDSCFSAPQTSPKQCLSPWTCNLAPQTPLVSLVSLYSQNIGPRPRKSPKDSQLKWSM